MAIGKPDHTGRCYGFGGINVGYKKAFGKAPPRSSQSSQSGVSQEDREALKAQIREELQEELDATIKQKLSSLLQEMGLSSGGNFSPTPRPQSSPLHLPPPQPQPSPAPRSHYSIPLLEEPTPCRLLVRDSIFGHIYDAAGGVAYPFDLGEQFARTHNAQRVDGHLVVKVETVPDEFKSAPLPVPVPQYDIESLYDAIGTFMQWPAELIKFSDETLPRAKKIKGMPLEAIESNEQPSGKSTARKSPLVQDNVVASLSPQCQWLHQFVASMPDGEPIVVQLDDTLFHYNEDGTAWLSKEDVSQFLLGSRLNISIIQVFMRSLQDDLVSCDIVSSVGWLCPDSTSEPRINAAIEEVKSYVYATFEKSLVSNHRFILAPIFQELHWMLLVICVQSGVIYLFDSSRSNRVIKMRSIVNHAIKRLTLNGARNKRVHGWP